MSDESSMTSLLNAMLKNPLAAAQLAVVLVGGYTLYSTLSQGIADVKSEASHDRQEAVTRSTRRQADIDKLNRDIADGQLRGINRYNDMQNKLDVQSEKITVTKDLLTSQISEVRGELKSLGTDIQWLIRRLDGSATAGTNNNGAGAPPSSFKPPR